MNRDDHFGLDLAHEFDDITVVDMSTRVSFDQITVRSGQGFLDGLPVWLIEVAAPARVETAGAWRKKAVEVALQHAGAEEHHKPGWFSSDFLHSNPGRGHQRKMRFESLFPVGFFKEPGEENPDLF